MTTFAVNETTLDERIRDAWTTYRDDLAALAGREYDDAEAESWERLQQTLRAIESDRATLGDTAKAGG